jgi:uncharacterized protein YndB with AHSA1/START domain
MTRDENTAAEVRRHFKVPPEKIFAAFADPYLVARWLSPSPQITLSVLQFKFRVGGTYRFAYELPGGQTVVVDGEYRRITPQSEIVFSWIIEPPDEHAGIESEVFVTITPDGNGSELHIRHEKLQRRDAVLRHTEGWLGAFDRLSALVETEIGI